MEKIIAYCGLNCSECPIFIATKKNDDKERQKVAKNWSKLLNSEYEKEDINCDGCHSKKGRLWVNCRNCDVRNCGLEMEVETCGHCIDYSCEKLDNRLKGFLKWEDFARKNLEAIRKSL
ncbi:MAG: DUF3795 domain-containing protein [Promethearchaeota archaeon]